MIFENGCIRLRAIEETDLDLLIYMMNDPKYDLQTGSIKPPISTNSQMEWMKNFKNSSTEVRLIIETVENKAIGLISLTNIDYINRTGNIQYKATFNRENRLKDDMKYAVEAILDYAFLHLGLNCVETKILVDNLPSRKLAKKVGFTEEGVIRQRKYFNGKFHDQINVSILKNEYLKIRNKD